MEEACLLTLNLWPEGYTSNLIQIKESKYSTVQRPWKPVGAICVLSSPHSRLPISPRKELVHISGIPVFAAATLGIPLNCPNLVTSRACVHRFSRKVANKEIILNSLSLQGSVWREQTEMSSFSVPSKKIFVYS